MLSRHRKTFGFKSLKIKYVDQSVVVPMIVFIVPHTQRNIKPIIVPRAH